MKDLNGTIDHLQRMLLSECHEQNHWTGQLSSSALSTATAVFALAAVDPQAHASAINPGIAWLIRHQNADGGWGDTTINQSNLSTTLLVYSALTVTSPAPDAIGACENYLRKIAGSLQPEALVQAVLQAYGEDQTFSVPILTVCALAGRLGQDAWSHVPGLPFELAVLPQTWFKWLQMPVVSYAMPALIAIGQVGFYHRRPACPIQRGLRSWARPRTLTVLTRLQPDNGGFLEATPLTSFVIMSLAHCGQRDHLVTRKGTRFLLDSQRPDGNWPIDTNLATWVSSLAIQALGPEGLSDSHRQSLLNWLLNQQHCQVHPYTRADPGGWAWTDLPGGVPDADDTSGALLALKILDPDATQCHDAIEPALSWLLDLQNRDGGIPTFSRGWGKLPFDRSCADLTAHALAAWSVWKPLMSPALQLRIGKAMQRALEFLRQIQRPDGAWTPLWFGNEHLPGMINPAYGTARTLSHLARLQPQELAAMQDPCQRALQWLLAAQQPNGAWGGDAQAPATIEETALVLDALASTLSGSHPDKLSVPIQKALTQGAHALIDLVDRHDTLPSSPIGLYFARLWYHEKLYPLIFSLAALYKVQQARKDSSFD
jgi:squalene-hopene/tetraprenyl-beta-curcumene cyclase